MTSTVLAVGNVLVLVSAALATASVVVHAMVRPPWWTSAVSRHLMAYMTVIAAVLDLAALRVIAGASLEVPWFVLVRTIVFAGVPVVLAWRLTLQVQLSRWIHAHTPPEAPHADVVQIAPAPLHREPDEIDGETEDAIDTEIDPPPSGTGWPEGRS